MWAFIIILKQSTASILYVHSAYEILKCLALKIWRYVVDGNDNKNSRDDYFTPADISTIALFNHILTCVCICPYLHDCSIRGGMKSLIFHLTFFLHSNAQCPACVIGVMIPYSCCVEVGTLWILQGTACSSLDLKIWQFSW